MIEKISMSTNRGQHYLPQMYLMGFTDTPGPSGRLFAHDLVRGTSFQTSTASVGKEVDYYRDRLDTEGTGFLDALLSKNESSAADVLRGLRNGEDIPARSSPAWDHLIQFISLSAIRSPAARKLSEDIAFEIANSVYEDPTFTDKDRASLDDGPPLESELLTAHELLLAARDGTPLSPPALATVHWQSVERILFTLPSVLHNRRWHLGTADAAEFVTCDAPVLLERTKPRGEVGFGNDNCNVVLTLSPDRALIGQPGGREGGERTVWDRRVEKINGLVVSATQRHVISKTADFRWRDDRGTRLRVATAMVLRRKPEPQRS